MKVYHGSWMEIAEPDLKHSRTDVDFGKGFYTTPLREQAVKWCGKFKRRGKQGIVTTYEFDESTSSSLKILSFDSYSEEWLDLLLVFNSCDLGIYEKIWERGKQSIKMDVKKILGNLCFSLSSISLCSMLP